MDTWTQSQAWPSLGLLLGDNYTSSWSSKTETRFVWLESPRVGLNKLFLGWSFRAKPLGSWVLGFSLLDWLFWSILDSSWVWSTCWASRKFTHSKIGLQTHRTPPTGRGVLFRVWKGLTSMRSYVRDMCSHANITRASLICTWMACCVCIWGPCLACGFSRVRVRGFASNWLAGMLVLVSFPLDLGLLFWYGFRALRYHITIGCILHDLGRSSCFFL